MHVINVWRSRHLQSYVASFKCFIIINLFWQSKSQSYVLFKLLSRIKDSVSGVSSDWFPYCIRPLLTTPRMLDLHSSDKTAGCWALSLNTLSNKFSPGWFYKGLHEDRRVTEVSCKWSGTLKECGVFHEFPRAQNEELSMADGRVDPVIENPRREVCLYFLF